jgi:hypothetical protein
VTRASKGHSHSSRPCTGRSHWLGTWPPTACRVPLYVVGIAGGDVVLVEHRVVLDAGRLDALGTQALDQLVERRPIVDTESEMVDADASLAEPLVVGASRRAAARGPRTCRRPASPRASLGTARLARCWSSRYRPGAPGTRDREPSRRTLSTDRDLGPGSPRGAGCSPSSIHPSRGPSALGRGHERFADRTIMDPGDELRKPTFRLGCVLGGPPLVARGPVSLGDDPVCAPHRGKSVRTASARAPLAASTAPIESPRLSAASASTSEPSTTPSLHPHARHATTIGDTSSSASSGSPRASRKRATPM